MSFGVMNAPPTF
jgi:hypothetical protein